MTTAFDQVAVDEGCLVHKCEKQGCSVDLADVPKPHHLIDMDHPASPATRGRCDYLLIGVDGARTNALQVVPLELKSTGFHATGVAKQLADGARTADKVVPAGQCRFVPVVVYERAHRDQFRRLKSQHVTFRRKKYAIRSLKCGASLSEVL